MKHKWLSGQGYVHVTLMTWVHVRGLAISIIFFNVHSYAGTLLRTTIQPPHLLSTCPRRSIKRLSIKAYGRCQSTCHTWSRKVNEFKQMGLNLPGLNLLIWGYTPPWFAKFIYFSYIFIYFNCYVILIICFI